MRELREFRAHHDELQRHGLAVAGVTRDSVASNLYWTERLHLPYPLLSDPEGRVGRAFNVVRRIGIGSWHVEFFRRSTFLIDERGEIAAAWGDVKIRGHAKDVLTMARTLARDAAERGASPGVSDAAAGAGGS